MTLQLSGSNGFVRPSVNPGIFSERVQKCFRIVTFSEDLAVPGENLLQEYQDIANFLTGNAQSANVVRLTPPMRSTICLSQIQRKSRKPLHLANELRLSFNFEAAASQLSWKNKKEYSLGIPKEYLAPGKSHRVSPGPVSSAAS